MRDYQALVEETALKLLPQDLGRQLQALLTSDGALPVALGLIHNRIGLLSRDLMTFDLMSDEGRLKGVRRQGEIAGLLLAIDIILTPAKENSDAAQSST